MCDSEKPRTEVRGYIPDCSKNTDFIFCLSEPGSESIAKLFDLGFVGFEDCRVLITPHFSLGGERLWISLHASPPC